MRNPSIQLQLHQHRQSIRWYQDGHNSKIFKTTEMTQADFGKNLRCITLAYNYNYTSTDKISGGIKMAITVKYLIQLR